MSGEPCKHPNGLVMLAEDKGRGKLVIYAKCLDCDAEYDEPAPGNAGWKRRKPVAAPPRTQVKE